MSNPRDAVEFEGQGSLPLTFIIDNSTITYSATAEGGSSQVGLAVKLTSANTLALTTDGSAVIGKLLSVSKDLKARVQVNGTMKLAGGNGASLTVGKKIVGALNASSAGGYIREVATGTAAELGLARGFIIDAGTTTAVEVCL
jgi:hypothetical protein